MDENSDEEKGGEEEEEEDDESEDTQESLQLEGMEMMKNTWRRR